MVTSLKKVTQSGAVAWAYPIDANLYYHPFIEGAGVPPATSKESVLVSEIESSGFIIITIPIIPAASLESGIDIEIEGHERILNIVPAISEESISAGVGRIIDLSSPAIEESSVLVSQVYFEVPIIPATSLETSAGLEISGHERIIALVPAVSHETFPYLFVYIAYTPEVIEIEEAVIQIVPAIEESSILVSRIITSLVIGLNFYTVYRCTLTGSNDSVDDLILKISNFTSRIRSGNPTYCSVTVPNAVLNLDGVSARLHGQLVIDEGRFFINGSSVFNEIVRVNLESIAYDTGTRNSSMSLSGHITQTNSSAKSINLNNSVSQESLQADGLIRIKTAVNFLVKPGDTIIWNNSSKSMVAGLITIVVGKTAYMDITEASA
jgi:hypothetical protein